MREEKEPVECPACIHPMLEYDNHYLCENCDFELEKSEPSAVDDCDINERRC